MGNFHNHPGIIGGVSCFYKLRSELKIIYMPIKFQLCLFGRFINGIPEFLMIKYKSI